jgi:hypothetical protein
MVSLSVDLILKFRSRTYHNTPGQELRTVEDAVSFVNKRGFIFFWPVKNVDMPSLWVAAAGDRPVADEHDDPGHITWGWKDELLGHKRWYYARVLRRRNTIISLSLFPYFYALSPNYGDPEIDYLEQYHQGMMTIEARNIYEALLREGPLDTLALRRSAHLSGQKNNSRFARALDDLQIELKVLPVGISSAGSWHYAFIYDLTPRHFPDLVAQARNISETAARLKLVDIYLHSVGSVPIKEISRLFGWNSDQTQETLTGLKMDGMIQMDLQVNDHAEEWVALNDIFTGV